MGGGGNPVKAVTKAASGVVNGGVKVATGGVVDLKNQKVSINPDTMVKNFTSGISGQDVMEKVLGTPKMPSGAGAGMAPPVEEQTKIADEVVEKKFDDLYKPELAGPSSTILGGSESEDTSVLKKKKLLGE